jgi:anti-sigma regulatory factor (Ser/Thr protein kinase)
MTAANPAIRLRPRTGGGSPHGCTAQWKALERAAPSGGYGVTDGDAENGCRSRQGALTVRLSGGPEAASRARRAVSELRGDLDAPLLESMRLLVTELVANSVRHAAGREVTLSALVTASSVWVEVSDAGPGFTPAERVRGQDEASGWGLFLVDRLASRWGVARKGSHTRVWFELKRG